MLSDDPFAVSIEDLDELTIVETIKGGKSIYKAGDSPSDANIEPFKDPE